jgi:hypothetical protein
LFAPNINRPQQRGVAVWVPLYGQQGQFPRALVTYAMVLEQPVYGACAQINTIKRAIWCAAEKVHAAFSFFARQQMLSTRGPQPFGPMRPFPTGGDCSSNFTFPIIWRAS